VATCFSVDVDGTRPDFPNAAVDIFNQRGEARNVKAPGSCAERAQPKRKR
jgi:hypothetical protein